MIDTAKSNGLDPTKYLAFLFEKLPNLKDWSNSIELETYLPWAKQVQLACK
ncbi:transposase domain-containing protein [Enterococcus sp. LJL99]